MYSSNPLLENNIYIVNADGNNNKTILIYNYADKEELEPLEEEKQDKEVLRVVNGTQYKIVDADSIPNENEISADDIRIKDLVDAGRFSIGDYIDITVKVLTEENFTEEFSKIIESIKSKNINNILFKNMVVNNLESNNTDLPLSANQGRILKEDYLDNIKFKHVDMANYSEATDSDDVNHQVKNAPVLYGLDAEQIEMLRIAYMHTFINTDEKYASKDEISDSKTNRQGTTFATLTERINDIERKLKEIKNHYNL